ncbi:uncharacterized protein [Dermacentor andersoni]|uniref:uncharacterized protein n=1 Tax=Dermacentor andersoni TaxID=34620 RepID=UPI003B3A11BB
MVLYAFFVPCLIYLTSQLELTALKRVSFAASSEGPRYVLNTSECRFPLYEPFHWSVAYFYRRKTSRENKCRGKEQFVFFVNSTVAQLNEKRLEYAHGLTPKALVCHYRAVLEVNGVSTPYVAVQTGPRRPLRFGEKLHEQHVQITCLRDGVPLFTEFHMLPQRKKSPKGASRDRRRYELNQRVNHMRKLSVLVVGVDSVSRLNSMRHLRKTRRYLSSQLNAYELLAFSAVTRNPLQSQISLLTGLDVREISRLPEHRNFHSPLHIVSAYKARGYATLFAVDATTDGSPFADDRWGYGSPPADYCPRSYVQALEHDERNAVCQSFTSRSEALLRYVSAFFQQDTNGVRKFGYVWLSQHVHGDINTVGYLDQPLKFFLRNLTASGVLNDTALLLLSNYGKRTGDFAFRSAFSEYEAKTPFCFLVLPEAFLRKNPGVAVALEVNQRRLVSAYDVHATLLTLAQLPDDKFEFTDRGLSLFRPLPPRRSCGDAFVQQDACACLNSRPTTLADVVNLSLFGRFAVDHMNNVTESNFPGYCIRWELGSVDKAQVIGGGEGVGSLELSVVITTAQNVSFEVFGGISDLSDSSAPNYHLSYISRLGSDEGPSTCINDKPIMAYCLCNSTLRKTRKKTG